MTSFADGRSPTKVTCLKPARLGVLCAVCLAQDKTTKRIRKLCHRNQRKSNCECAFCSPTGAVSHNEVCSPQLRNDKPANYTAETIDDSMNTGHYQQHKLGSHSVQECRRKVQVAEAGACEDPGTYAAGVTILNLRPNYFV